jgi:hypothetical protein
VSDVDQEVQEEPRQDSDNLAEVRAYGERQARRAKELESENIELRNASRVMGLRAADVDPESWLGRTVLEAAGVNNMTSIEDVANLARLIRAEAQGA